MEQTNKQQKKEELLNNKCKKNWNKERYSSWNEEKKHKLSFNFNWLFQIFFINVFKEIPALSSLIYKYTRKFQWIVYLKCELFAKSDTYWRIRETGDRIDMYQMLWSVLPSFGHLIRTIYVVSNICVNG